MVKRSILLMISLGLIMAASSESCEAWDHFSATRAARQAAASQPWHGPHAHTSYGMPLALVVPPTAGHQAHWGWGVGGSQASPIRAQFTPSWPGPSTYGPHARFLPTPSWPTNTYQFGVYYVRGPR